jgi:hypothetical protein
VVHPARMHPAGPLRPRRVGGRSPPPRGTQPENHPRPAERRLSERESESESELPRTSRFSARQAHTNVSRRVKRASQNPFRALPLSVAGGALSLLGARAHARRSTRSRLHVTHSMHRSLARRVGRTRFGAQPCAQAWCERLRLAHARECACACGTTLLHPPLTP